MKFHSCHYCDSSVSELGSYVQISNKLWAHLACRDKEMRREGYDAGRASLLEEQRTAREMAVSQAVSDAVRQYEAAIRCLKCGVPMLSERPTALPAAFTTTTPSPSTAATCSLCVRREADLRNAARQAPVAGTTASLMQPKPQAQAQETSTLQPGGRPIEID